MTNIKPTKPYYQLRHQQIPQQDPNKAPTDCWGFVGVTMLYEK